MEIVNSLENAVQKRPGILYPMMLIAAITLIVFSVAGIATMMGWMPGAQSRDEPRAKAAAGPSAKAAPDAARPSRPRAVASAPAACADCGK